MGTLMEDRQSVNGHADDFVMSELRLAIDPESVAYARQFVKVVLSAWSVPDTDDAELLLSEVATNVLKHTGNSDQPMHIRIERVGARVRIEVHDPSSNPPKPRKAGVLDQSGHGLFLVEMIAIDWGFSTFTSSKVVWFEMKHGRR